MENIAADAVGLITRERVRLRLWTEVDEQEPRGEQSNPRWRSGEIDGAFPHAKGAADVK